MANEGCPQGLENPAAPEGPLQFSLQCPKYPYQTALKGTNEKLSYDRFSFVSSYQRYGNENLRKPLRQFLKMYFPYTGPY